MTSLNKGDLSEIKSTIRYKSEPADRINFLIRKIDGDTYVVTERPEHNGVFTNKHLQPRIVDMKVEDDLVYLASINTLLRYGLTQNEQELPFYSEDKKGPELLASNDLSILITFLGEDISTDVILKVDDYLSENVNPKTR